MGIFSRKPKKQPEEERSAGLGLSFNFLSSFSNQAAMKLSAVYCAVNQISDSIALLPINVVRIDGDRKRVVKHNLTRLLNYKPNKKYTHFNFMKYMIESVLLRGAGYAYIVRDDKLNTVEIQLLDSDYVTPMPQADGSVKYLIAGFDTAVDSDDILDFHMHVDEMYHGISVLKYARNVLEGSADADAHSNKFFKSGANLSGVIKAASVVSNEQKQQIRESWRSAFVNNQDGVGVAILPQGLEFQPISVNPEDAQLLESRQFNILEIARFFKIPPSKLYVLENESYNSLEMAQLLYLMDTIQPYTQMIEEELMKLLKPSERERMCFEFDFDALLETDKKSLASYYREMLVNGICTPNEIRAKLNMEAMPAELGGDDFYMQMSYTTLKNIKDGLLVNQKQSQAQEVDNKVKSGE